MSPQEERRVAERRRFYECEKCDDCDKLCTDHGKKTVILERMEEDVDGIAKELKHHNEQLTKVINTISIGKWLIGIFIITLISTAISGWMSIQKFNGVLSDFKEKYAYDLLKRQQDLFEVKELILSQRRGDDKK